MSAPLWMIPRVSRGAIRACLALHLLAAAACLTAWPWSPPLGVAAALLVAAGQASAAALRALPERFAAVLLTADGQWTLTDWQGERQLATLCGTPLVAPWFAVVTLRVRDRRYCWLASADTLPANTLRGLRLRLRCGPAARATACAAE